MSEFLEARAGDQMEARAGDQRRLGLVTSGGKGW